MTGAEAYSPPRDVVAYLTRLQELAQYAAERGDATEQAVLVAELQRLGMQALQFAVAHARQRGASWRDLAGALGIPVTTLRRQYAAGAMSAGHLFGAAQPVAAQPATRSRIRGPAGAAEPRLSVVPAAGLDQFVGRERELADLRPLLARQRMVTLTGPAGVGKTRLAVELIPHVRRAYPGGLWWVDLAPLPNEAPVPDAVAAAVGAGGSAHRGLGRTIANACATRPALLILDNCEHLAAGCAELA